MVALKKRALDEDTLDTNGNDTAADTAPDTKPEGLNGELVEAVEWLKKAGVVSAEKPTFSGFFEELVEPQPRVVTELSRAYTPSNHVSNDD